MRSGLIRCHYWSPLLMALLVFRVAGADTLSKLRHYRSSFTVKEALAFYGAYAGHRLRERFADAGVAYPPDKVRLVAIKHPGVLEMWARKGDDAWRFIHEYPVLAASGTRGPKLREGDLQVPEGVYRIVGLNPNSAFHLSLKLNYPNRFDRRQAHRERRLHPGSNIYIHGKRKSKGCLAMGDRAIEELFVMAADVGIRNVEVVIAPYDFRRRAIRLRAVDPPWVKDLYQKIAKRLAQLPLSKKR